MNDCPLQTFLFQSSSREGFMQVQWAGNPPAAIALIAGSLPVPAQPSGCARVAGTWVCSHCPLEGQEPRALICHGLCSDGVWMQRFSQPAVVVRLSVGTRSASAEQAGQHPTRTWCSRGSLAVCCCFSFLSLSTYGS